MTRLRRAAGAPRPGIQEGNSATSGTILVDVLVALAIVAVAAAPVLSLVSTSVRRLAVINSVAVDLLQQSSADAEARYGIDASE